MPLFFMHDFIYLSGKMEQTLQGVNVFGNYERPSLRSKLGLLLICLIVTTTVGAALTLRYVYRTQSLFRQMQERDITGLVAAQGLQKELVAQKGFVTYFFLNGDPEWLADLEKHHEAFEGWLHKARESEYLDQGREVLNQIESAYLRFTHERSTVIELYQQGDRAKGAQRHWKVRDRFNDIYALCEQYKRLHEQSMARESERYRREARILTILSLTAMPLTIALALWLGYILFRRILDPLRRLAHGEGAAPNLSGEMGELQQRLSTLIDDVDEAHTMLQETRQQVAQAEKMALVGKLAAGVAHSIRNPLTSVKMRLFSLERSLNLSPVQQEDFEVISEEIRHLDTIIRNFLEFSRPPKLRMQRVSPSEVVDMTLQLLRHRLDSCGVEIRRDADSPLPEVDADPEQLKEVLVNLIVNACDAMQDGGLITIEETMGNVGGREHMAVITVSDNGPGIPPSVRDEIFRPFFSTKEEGTGLGLSIANRIMTEHGGWIHLKSSGRKGTTFLLALPHKETSQWHRS